MSFADKIKKVVENAPVAMGGTFIQYGKLSVEINVITWKGKGQQPDREPYEEDMEIDEEKQDIEFTFKIDVKELNPGLNWDSDFWSRKINMKKSGGNNKTDWSETVLPSLQKTFGDKWADVLTGKVQPYVECEQASSQYVKPGAKDYGVPKFLRAFKNKAACIEARNERYGAPEDADKFNEDGELGIPSDLIEQAKGLWKSVKGNEKKFKSLITELEDFEPYDFDAVLAEVK